MHSGGLLRLAFAGNACRNVTVTGNRVGQVGDEADRVVHYSAFHEFDPGCVADSAGAYRAGAGTVFVVAAAGGAELYNVHRKDPEAGYFAAAMGRNSPGKHFGLALLDVTPKRMTVRFVGSTHGSFEDAFELKRRASD